MKLFAYIALPLASTLAFAPDHASQVLKYQRGGGLGMTKIDEVSEKITSTTEEYVSKADDLVIGRLMRVVDHAPAIYTLRELAKAGGISASLSGVSVMLQDELVERVRLTLSLLSLPCILTDYIEPRDLHRPCDRSFGAEVHVQHLGRDLHLPGPLDCEVGACLRRERAVSGRHHRSRRW